MAKSFEDLMKKTCSKDVIIDGYKKTMDYWAEYIGLSKNQYNVVPSGWSMTKIKPKKAKRRDPARRWK
jgi:hypothetical protein